jgi:hypothetical protein
MDEIKWIVAPNKSISTKAGIKGPLEEVTRKMIGPNFDKLVEKGFIIDESTLEFKNDVEKQEADLVKSDEIIERPVSEYVKEEKPEEKELTKKEIKALLKEKGIEYNDRANKTDLLKLLEGEKKPEFGAQKTEENE